MMDFWTFRLMDCLTFGQIGSKLSKCQKVKLSNLLLLGDGLICSDGDEFVNIIDGAAAAQIVARLCKTLEDWTNSFSTCKTLNEFVSDVADFEAWEDQGVGLTSDRAVRSLACTD